MQKYFATLLLSSFLMFSLSGCSTISQQEPEVNKQEEIATVNVRLGLAYLQQDHVDRAKTKLFTAIKADPKLALANGAMAYFYEKTGDSALAEKYYKNAIHYAKHGAGAERNNYGAYLCRDKRYEEAEANFNRAVNDRHYIRAAEAYENAGLCAMEIAQTTKAQAYFKQAIAKDPQRVTSYYGLTEIAYKQHRFHLADKYIQQYMRLTGANPRSSLLAYNIANKLNDNVNKNKYSKLLQEYFPESKEAKSLQV